MPRERTAKQQAVLDALLMYGRPAKRTEVCKRIAMANLPTLTEQDADRLPWTEGTARDILEALVRRGEARRVGERPIRYEAVLVHGLQDD